MRTTFILNPFPHYIIENIYDEKEKQSVDSELFFLYNSNFIQTSSPDNTTFLDNKIIGNRKLIFLKDVFVNIDKLEIYKCISNLQLIFKKDNNYLSRSIQKCRTSDMLISFYENNNYYDAHIDDCFLSYIAHWLPNGKNFTGGDLFFPEYDYTYEIKHNCGILFNSSHLHGVHQVVSDESVLRISMTTFLY